MNNRKYLKSFNSPTRTLSIQRFLSGIHGEFFAKKLIREKAIEKLEGGDFVLFGEKWHVDKSAPEFKFNPPKWVKEQKKDSIAPFQDFSI